MIEGPAVAAVMLAAGGYANVVSPHYVPTNQRPIVKSAVTEPEPPLDPDFAED